MESFTTLKTNMTMLAILSEQKRTRQWTPRLTSLKWTYLKKNVDATQQCIL